MNVILIAIISTGVIALVAAIVLFAASKKFAVHEDPRIGQVTDVLPQANCGGCGYPGCAGLAAAIVKAGSLEGKFCPVGGLPVMERVAAVMGLSAQAADPMVAVVRCNGTCENRPRITRYDGVRSCAIAAALYGGETACSYGCLGCGDCVAACQFGAIAMNPQTGLPEVDERKCTACGACVKACPKNIIELRRKGKDNRRVFVRCVNQDKGIVVSKACKTGCIACGKCEKVCGSGAITISNNLAYINDSKCLQCRKCVEACPKNAIAEVNFPAPLAKAPVAASKAPASPQERTPVAKAQARPSAGVAVSVVAHPKVDVVARIVSAAVEQRKGQPAAPAAPVRPGVVAPLTPVRTTGLVHAPVRSVPSEELEATVGSIAATLR